MSAEAPGIEPISRGPATDQSRPQEGSKQQNGSQNHEERPPQREELRCSFCNMPSCSG
jgi:hypothetical protein